MFEIKGKNRMIDDDSDTLEYSSSVITDEERKRAEKLLKELTG